MGILDDAIREHLDLRRKHGAPEEELQRQEEEALGPARREVSPSQAQDTNGAGEPAAEEAGATQAAVPAQADAAGDTAPEPPPEAPTEAPSATSSEPEATVEASIETPREESPPEAAAQEPPEPIVATERAPPEETSFDAVDPEPPAAEPEPAPAAEALEPKSDTPADGFEALEGDDFSGDEEQPAGNDADVLEDTPDFLQETPEHDRLWFEQKPPRDFDFD
jgi:hypothetical protein